MKQFLLSVHMVEGQAPPEPEVMQQMFKDVEAYNQELQSSGAWVFACGLEAPNTSTVVREQDGQIVTTDGPFVETKEQLGGFSIIDVADLDEALAWAEKLSDATTCGIEVRPFVDGPPN